MLYQLFEFLICGLDLNEHVFAYFAFSVITFLPPLSLILVLSFFNLYKKRINLIFILSIGFIAYYGFTISHFEILKCTPLYAAYNYPLGDLFGAYYYSPILISIIILIIKTNGLGDKEKIKLAKFLLFGFLFILFPVTLAFILLIFHNHFLVNIIESVMCKFALVFAICLSYFSIRYKIKAE